jgi:hypothetical protein
LGGHGHGGSLGRRPSERQVGLLTRFVMFESIRGFQEAAAVFDVEDVVLGGGIESINPRSRLRTGNARLIPKRTRDLGQ